MKSLDEIERLRPDQRTLAETILLSIDRSLNKVIAGQFIGNPTSLESYIGMKLPWGTVTGAEWDMERPDTIVLVVAPDLDKIDITLEVV